ncbi:MULTISPECIES: sulfite reductase subunit alpha [unclassified Undibacterium]|uniref:sulfite reductase subunit alpha n=1 Tax=unclassified Undibacterium TaxID=2630295 RepID=UPI002AC8A530|nr:MULTISPECIES: sulfite reductase subunit alpha [unclassified Undibacterium]MEB0140480.1 sulfite reductase subunit alpha [Undibacterium sp. CCC2.1]MEB0173723.1 sulfite reductase subunit alpha [Undibacterium sp. CCC1.1]MEB0177723.1 sulfite reductase subunit alpha [Undibacterium sp. CCC3.4]MEB0217020.1 sulfite reductase subunit alpha [Undibacterium sp. 5I2]WPX44611.1 sulfite reductase subunit alpha [Undibacterium sp. CCC3.4]
MNARRSLHALAVLLLLAALLCLQLQLAANLYRATLIAAYLSFCSALWFAQRRAPSANGAAFCLAYASQTGSAQALANAAAAQLKAAGHVVELLPLNELTRAHLAMQRRVIFIVSTAGDGGAPDNGLAFQEMVMRTTAALPDLAYAVVALGDRRYRQFCRFGKQLEQWLMQQQAQALFAKIEIDDGDQQAMQQWQEQLQALGAAAPAALGASAPASFSSWTLCERQQLNPGSQGAPVFHLALRAPDLAPHWQAGDIAEILSGPEQNILRAYTIASLPADGQLELLIRQRRADDGRLGPGSAWLTEQAALGAPITLRIRAQAGGCHGAPTGPQILIGNGTGMAGLRARLKAQAAAGQQTNWLLFGEREAAHDFFYRAEIEAWQASGVISQLSTSFSRDQPQRRYVQHALQEQATSLREWVEQGAAILVCGSRDGMAEAVDAVLQTVLGSAQLRKMTETGRYRRDVY